MKGVKPTWRSKLSCLVLVYKHSGSLHLFNKENAVAVNKWRTLITGNQTDGGDSE